MPSPLRALVDEFAGQTGLPPNAANDVEAAIASSPYLTHVMVDAVKQRTLKHIGITREGNEGGHYDRKSGTVFVGINGFTQDLGDAIARIDNIAAILGHETGHALTEKARSAEIDRLSSAIEIKLTEGLGNTSQIDVTADAERYLNFTRNDEALSELISMNSVASRIGSRPGGYNLQQFLERVDASTGCVKRHETTGQVELAPDIELSKHGFQLTGNRFKSPAVEAVAACHYDQGASLGRNGDSNYRNYYGPTVLATIAAVHADIAKDTTQAVPDIHLDLKRLRLDLAQIERNGVNLPGAAQSFSFTDTSDGKLAWKTVNDTSTGMPEPGPRDVGVEATAARPAFRADSPGHPDYPTFERFHRAAQADGRWSDVEARNLAAAGLAAVKGDVLVGQYLSGVVVGKGADGATNLIGYASPHGPAGPHHHLAVNADVAAQVPAEKSLDRVEQLNQEHARQQAHAQTLATDGPSRNGPKIAP
ncbi:hypothetical protein J5226_06990 [Lysobacter sp. K5869]|uniref:hypothetical protein n=1 Tax=Lysobacter sp. K5869 TaxID=2820808 RepID=UPI001C062925|nr:hypothetical protein [Lysobacter sp. K5869]QWP78135.1 hypothetical protein J5226_06990 [Lysobacter sp. K5869]